MRLTPFLIASLFIFLFGFGIQTQVFAQNNTPASVCPDAPAVNQQVCFDCRMNTGGDYITKNQAQCNHWIDSWGKAGSIPKEQENQNKAMSASYGTNATTLETTVFNRAALVNGKITYNGNIFGALAGGILGLMIPQSNAGTPLVYSGPNGQSTTVAFGPSAIDTINNLTAQMVGKPQISSGEYFADLMQNLKNPLGAQPAYAQGLGFSALAPVLTLWKLFRNIAYFFFVIIFLVIGFMIMFRSKIGGQAAVTIQQALPKIVISLLLVTFSYAIAGLMIDVMYLLIYLMIGLFTTFFPGGAVGVNTLTGQTTTLTQVAFTNNIVQNTFALIGNGVVGNVSGALGNIVVKSLGLTESDLGGIGAQGLTNVIFTLILAVAILVSMFRVFFELLKAYIFVFFSVIFAPIQLLLGAIPGQNTFGSWLTGLLENLLVFPTIILMIFIAYFFSVGPYGTQAGNAKPNGGFSAPQLSSNQGAGFPVYQSLLALGAILAMPEVLKVTKGLMKGKIDVSPKDLVNNLAAGNQYAAPAVGLAAGAAYGVGAGAYFGKKRGTGVWDGIWNGARDTNGVLRGGLSKSVGSGWGKGLRLAKTIDRIQDGKFFDPDNISKQLDELNKNVAAGKGGADSHGGSGTKPPKSRA